MAMTERSRRALYEGLSGIIDEEAIGEMLSYFPARDAEEPATKELVRAEFALVRAEGALVRAECADVRAEVSQLRADVEQRFGEVERRFGDVERRFGDVERRFGDLRSELVAEIRSSTRWTIGAMVTLAGVLVAAMAALG